MDVYVSGSIRNMERARNVMNAFRDAGHTITHDWTTWQGEKMHQPEALRQRQGVFDADVLVLLVHPRLKAGWMEFGAAVAHDLPCVVVPDVLVSESMWYTLDTVHVMSSNSSNTAKDIVNFTEEVCA